MLRIIADKSNQACYQMTPFACHPPLGIHLEPQLLTFDLKFIPKGFLKMENEFRRNNNISLILVKCFFFFFPNANGKCIRFPRILGGCWGYGRR